MRKRIVLAMIMLLSFLGCARTNDTNVNISMNQMVEKPITDIQVIDTESNPSEMISEESELEEEKVLIFGESNKDNLVYLRLGELWDDDFRSKCGIEEGEGVYISDEMSPSGALYKYWSHEYPELSIVTSNIFWDLEERDIDTYVVYSIHTKSLKHELGIGIYVGDTKETVLKVLGDNYEEVSPQLVKYEYANAEISVVFENNVVTDISIVMVKENSDKNI